MTMPSTGCSAMSAGVSLKCSLFGLPAPARCSAGLWLRRSGAGRLDPRPAPGPHRWSGRRAARRDDDARHLLVLVVHPHPALPPARFPGPADTRATRSLLVGVLVDDLGVHDVVVVRGGTGTGGTGVEAAVTGTGGAGAVGLRLGVQRAADLLRDPGDLLLGRLDRGDVGPTEGGAQLGQGLAQLLLLVGRDLVAVL